VRSRVATVIGAFLVLCVAGGGAALAVGRDAGPRYRTATVGNAAVEQTLEATGAVASAQRSDVAFSVGGTVASVPVSLGQTVAAGDVLATLDPNDLQDALEQKQSALADAQQALEDDLASQTASVTTSVATTTASTTTTTGATTGTAGTSTPGTPSGGSAAAPDPAVTAALAAVHAAQTSLLDQYDVTTRALATSAASLAASTEACAPLQALDAGSDAPTAEEPSPTAEPSSTAEPTSTSEPSPAPSADPAPTTAELLAACQAAIAVVQEDQATVDAAQTMLRDLATALDRAVAAAQDALRHAADALATSTTGAAGASQTTGSSQSTATGAAGGTTTSAAGAAPATPESQAAAATTVASAEDVLADRAAIDLAQGQVALAQSRLDRITLTSPLAGTVAAVGLAVGDSVSASSTTAVITVIGTGGHLVRFTLPLSVIDTAQVGQTAEVTVASTDDVLTGTVSSIGVLNASTTTSDPSYTVVLTLDPSDARLFDGAAANVRLQVGAATDATLTVPTSAVHVDGAAATVDLLKDGTAVSTTVTLGTMGSELTEITSGLAAGDTVVLADLDKPLSTGTATTESGLSGLSGSSSTTSRSTSGVPAGPPAGGRPANG
jgi:HlyD family secretion protein